MSDNTQTPEEKAKAAKNAKPVPRKRWKLKIHASTEGDNADVLIGVNGRLLQIKRGVEVEVGEEYVEALKNARIDTFTKDPDNGKEVPISMMRYSFEATEV